MLKLHAVQANFGDCLILEFGSQAKPSYLLIDGGPPTIYENHLKSELLEITKNGGKLDLVILSHVDNDHVTGLLDMMAELEQQKTNGDKKTILIDSLWHNTFKNTIDTTGEIQNRIKSMFTASASLRTTMAATDNMMLGIGEGERLRRFAEMLSIPINKEFGNNVIIADDVPQSIPIGNLKITIVGPTKDGLENLKKEWLDWLEKHEDKVSDDPAVAAMADKSIPNLSSIMILVESEGKKLLMTGDGRGDHLLQGLEQAKLLDDAGTFHVDLLKVPHHGSDRNVTKEFFKTVIADEYVISADGKYGNPDSSTLEWIAESAKEMNRQIKIYVTNTTDSIKEFTKNFPANQYNYELEILEKGKHSLQIEIS
jgi:beta-lactamase superfamily II metal-dependent hydrolase